MNIPSHPSSSIPRGYLRVSVDIDMVAVEQTFREVLDGCITAIEGQEKLADYVKFAPFSNGFYHGEEGAAYVS